MGVPIEGPRRVRVPADVLMRELGEEAVLLHLGTETYFGLDAVGARFWRALTEAPSLGDALQRLLGTYDVDAQELGRDLEAFLDELVGHGLLDVAAG